MKITKRAKSFAQGTLPTKAPTEGEGVGDKQEATLTPAAPMEASWKQGTNNRHEHPPTPASGMQFVQTCQ